MKILLFSAGQMMRITDGDARKLDSQLSRGLNEGAFKLESGSSVYKHTISAIADQSELLTMDEPWVDDTPKKAVGPAQKAKK